jgi:uncharacterized protein YdeI (YjbR/CyaY-like superfamily)
MRAIALASGLDEVLKWGQPCYTLDRKNVVVIHTFKEYCAFLFFKGASRGATKLDSPLAW